MPPPRLNTPLLWPAPAGGLLNIDKWRRRANGPGRHRVRHPTRRPRLRPALQFASNALPAGLGAFELAKVMVTSIEMTERHYGTLLDGAGARIAGRHATFEAERDDATRDAADVQATTGPHARFPRVGSQFPRRAREDSNL